MINSNLEHLAKLLLDDDNGINSRAWNYLKPFLSLELVSIVKCQDDRYYIKSCNYPIGRMNKITIKQRVMIQNLFSNVNCLTGLEDLDDAISYAWKIMHEAEELAKDLEYSKYTGTLFVRRNEKD